MLPTTTSIVGFLLLLLFVALAHAQTTAPELQALHTLYNATGGPQWRIPWDIRSDPCINEWNGVKCRAIGNNQFQVTSLVVQGNNLKGTIPAAIGSLTNLQFLYLSGNQLVGTIPSEVGQLLQLVQLGFDKNQLSGGFPDMSRLAGLQTIYFQDNLFTGPLDNLGRLPGVQYLWLSRNKLMGTIPNNLASIFSLQQIGLDSNSLTGTVPSGFGSTQNLFQAFYGQGNQFSGPFPTNLCKTAQCDLSGPLNMFTCPLPTPSCCHVTACKP